MSTIGPDKTILNTFNCNKVEFANWGNWYNNTKIDCLEANPYRTGAQIWAGGIQIKTVEIPEDATAIPDFKNAGLTFEGELELPAGVKYIGKFAFTNQKNLWSVEFPMVLEEIAEYAFMGCETLSFDELPESLKSIGDYAFMGCNMQKSIVLPEGLESLGKGVFREMAALTSANMVSNLTEVPDETFAGCSQLEKVYMPVDATRIGDFAFLNCFTYDEVMLPKSLEEIGNGAFFYGTQRWDETSIDQIINVLTYNSFDVTTSYRDFKESVTQIEFPTSLKNIAKHAFFGQNFVNLNLEGSLETIGDYAFYQNANLSSLSLSESLQSVGKEAFAVQVISSEATMLSRLVIPDATTTLGDGAFCRPIGEVIVGSGIKSLENESTGYPLMITIGPNVTSIANNGLGFKFDDTSYLKIIHFEGTKSPTVTSNFNLTETDYDYINVYVPDGSLSRYTANPRWKPFTIVEESQAAVQVHVSVASLAEEIRLQSGIHPSRVAKLKLTGTLADSDWRILRENMISLTELDLSSITNTTLPENALSNMKYLTKLKLPSNLSDIGRGACALNTLMDIDEIPASVTSIGESAFRYCAMLTISELPEALETIEATAFAGCSSLKKIIAYENLASLGDIVFLSCQSLEFVDLSKTKVESIPSGTFSGATSLSTVLLPNGLTTIGGSAFMETSLSTIALPKSVTSIGDAAFQSTLLRGVNIPEGVKSINARTFASCPRLVSVSFPASMEEIGTLVFENSLKVTGLSCARVEAPNAETGAFTGMRVKKVALTVPKQSYRSYLSAPQWGIFADLINRMDVDMPKDIVVTIVDEAEYQEIVEAEEMAELYVTEEEVEEPMNVVRRAAKQSLIKGENFSRLFPGATVATVTDPNSPGYRVFIDADNVSKIEYDGQDITSRFDGESILISGALNGTLKISATSSGIEDVEVDNDATIPGSAYVTAYDTTGRPVYTGLRAYLEDSVAPGIYILRADNRTEKVLVK